MTIAEFKTPAAGELIIKSTPVRGGTLKFDDGRKGVATAIVSVTAVRDSQGDIIDPGAYSKFISAWKSGAIKAPARCWDHDWGRPTGVTTDLVELMPGDPRLPDDLKAMGAGGLQVTYKYVLGADDGRNAYELAKAGAFAEHSVGFLIDEPSEAEGKAFEYTGGVRHIKRIMPLVEHSDVLMGAAPRTQTTSIKSAQEQSMSDDPVVKARQERRARTKNRVRSARFILLSALTPAEAELRAEWSTAFQNGLDDDAFAYIEPGGSKDDDGRTTPRSLRHYPLKGSDGKYDEAHVKNAMSRAQAQINGGEEPGASIAKKAMPAIEKAYKALGLDLPDSDDSSKSAEGDVVEKMKHSHWHVHASGVAHGHAHSHGSDVPEHDAPAFNVPHRHGHSDEAPKSALALTIGDADHEHDDVEHKDAGVSGLPTLTGDEAPHNMPLDDAFTAINTLIAQELAEDSTEYACIMSLCHVAQCLEDWANGEAEETSIGYNPFAEMAMLWAARPAVEAKGEPEPLVIAAESEATAEEKGGDVPAWMVAGVAAYLSRNITDAPQLTSVPSQDSELNGEFDAVLRATRPAPAQYR